MSRKNHHHKKPSAPRRGAPRPILSVAELETFREELRAWREAFNISQAAAATLVGVHEYTWARWERGESTPSAVARVGLKAMMQSFFDREASRQAMAKMRKERKAQQSDAEGQQPLKNTTDGNGPPS